MVYEEDFVESKEHAGAALTLMEKRVIPHNPQNYSIWYEYHCGRNPELRHKVDELVAQGVAFTDEVNERLYEEFFAAGRERAAVQRAARNMNEQLGQVKESLANASEGTSRYSQALHEFEGKVRTSSSPEELGEAVKGMVAETRSMQDHNRALESRIVASTLEIDQLKHELEEVRREAMTDPLTGIANRKFFDEQLIELTKDAALNRQDLSLLLIDVDHFRQFNDKWGIAAGDQFLRLLARVLLDSVKPSDLAARYGGEEFAVVLPKARLSNAVTVAHVIRQSLHNKKIVKKSTGEDLGALTLSVGAAALQHGEPVVQLLRRAEEALAEAKNGGRNRIVTQDSAAAVVAR